MPSFPEAAAKGGDSWATISQILAKTISGQATMAEFDAMIADDKKTFGFLDDLPTAWIQKNKAAMIAKGWKGADW